jgi:hypothetical protein
MAKMERTVRPCTYPFDNLFARDDFLDSYFLDKLMDSLYRQLCLKQSSRMQTGNFFECNHTRNELYQVFDNFDITKNKERYSNVLHD